MSCSYSRDDNDADDVFRVNGVSMAVERKRKVVACSWRDSESGKNVGLLIGALLTELDIPSKSCYARAVTRFKL